MGDLKARIRARFSRSNSAAPSVASSTHSGRRKSFGSQRAPSTGHTDKNDGHDAFADGATPVTDDDGRPPPPRDAAGSPEQTANDATEGTAPAEGSPAADASASTAAAGHSAGPGLVRAASDMSGSDQRQLSSINEDLSPPPSADDPPSASSDAGPRRSTDTSTDEKSSHLSVDSSTPTPTPRPTGLRLPSSSLATPTASRSSPSANRPATLPRLLSNRQSTLIRTLLSGNQAGGPDAAAAAEHLLPLDAMVTRKIWVKRPGASATLVTVHEDDVVDDVRDMILRKYANSLGRQFDSPDLTLRVKPREQVERTLNPEESINRILDVYFPGGQTVDEALVVDVPLRRTPRASPRTGPPHAPHLTTYFTEDARPSEAGTDYFGPAAVVATHVPLTVTAPSTGGSHGHAMSVLTTGQVPQLPSPGGTRSRQYRDRPDRPRLGRQHTSSPTIVHVVPAAHAPNAAAVAAGAQGRQFHARKRSHTYPRYPRYSSSLVVDPTAPLPTAAPLPTPPPAPEATVVQRTSTPPPQRVASPRPTAQRVKKSKKTVDHPSLPAGSLAGGVPPINVLIVEDNIINLKLLEAFMKRLKVRWQSAMNGREAVTRWRTGGFHLVLMDIQLPVMSGLDATREIRRLERVNSIGVFSSSASSAPDETNGDAADADILPNVDMFRSPVIIVALTASSLQSDRHEALAAGCNDFLTKVRPQSRFRAGREDRGLTRECRSRLTSSGWRGK